MLLAVIFILSHTLLCGEQDSDVRVPCFRVTMVDFSSLPLATAAARRKNIHNLLLFGIRSKLDKSLLGTEDTYCY